MNSHEKMNDMKRKIRSLIYLIMIGEIAFALIVPLAITIPTKMKQGFIVINGGIIISNDAQWPSFPGITGGGTPGNPYIVADELIISTPLGGALVIGTGLANPVTSYVLFKNCTFRSNHYPTVFAQGVFHETFYNCTFEQTIGTTLAFFLNGGGSMNFTKDVFISTTQGLGLYASDSIVKDCTFNGIGIGAMASSGDNNQIINDTFENLPNLAIQSMNPVSIANCTFKDVGSNALQLYSYAPATITGTSFIRCGIALISCEAGNVTVDKSFFYQNRQAIDFNISYSISVTNSVFKDNGPTTMMNGATTYWQSNYQPTFLINNTFSGNAGDAILINLGAKAIIKNNTFEGSDRAIFFSGAASGSSVTNSTFNTSGESIRVAGSNNIDILNNTFASYPGGVIKLLTSNTIDIINNTFASGINIIDNSTGLSTFNASANYYLDFFARYPNAVSNFAKTRMTQEYQISTHLNDSQPLYSDKKFPNARLLSRTFVLAAHGYNASQRIYVDDVLATSDFIPIGDCYRATIRNSTTNVILFDAMQNVFMRYSIKLIAAIITPSNGTIEKADFPVIASVYNLAYDINKVWISIFNQTGFIKNETMTKVMTGVYQANISIYDFVFGDHYTIIVHANDSSNNQVSARVLVKFHQPEIYHIDASSIIYKSDNVFMNQVIPASITIHHDGFLRSNETLVYIPSDWQNAANAIITRGSNTYIDQDLTNPILFDFLIPTYASMDTVSFTITTPHLKFVNGSNVNNSVIYTIAADEAFSNIAVTISGLKDGWTFQLQSNSSGSWVNVDPASYFFTAINSTACSFVVPSINAGTVLAFKIVMIAPLPNLSSLYISLGIAGAAAAGIVIVVFLRGSYSFALKRRK